MGNAFTKFNSGWSYIASATWDFGKKLGTDASALNLSYIYSDQPRNHLNNDSSRWQKLAAIDEEKFEAAVAAAKDAAGQVTTAAMLRAAAGMPHVANNSGENEWYTPPEIIEIARSVMGGIDTDPATSEIANQTVGAALIYTAKDDGRTKEWRGSVWMNPPYAQPLVGDFAEATTAKYASGEYEQACILVNNATERDGSVGCSKKLQRSASREQGFVSLIHRETLALRCRGRP